MRIALAVHDYDRHGGHSRYTVELVERLAPLHEVHVFANTFGVTPPAGVVTHHVPAWRARALTTIVTFPLPATLAVGRGFDVVHAQGVCLHGANVVTAHVCHAAWYDACRQEGRRFTLRDRLFESVVVPLERRLYHRPRAAVIAVSAAVEQQLRHHYGCPAEIAVIPHGVDRAQFNPSVRTLHRQTVRARFGIGPDDPLFLFVGDARKGLDPVLRAISRLDAARLVVVSRSHMEPYRATAAALGITARTVFAGVTTRVHEFFGAADSFVFPTPYDAFGLVLTESMACGVPPIASRAAGASEWIDDGRTGWLLPECWSVDDLTRLMRQVIDHPDRARAVGDAAVGAIADLSWDNVARDTLKVYEVAARKVSRPVVVGRAT